MPLVPCFGFAARAAAWLVALGASLCAQRSTVLVGPPALGMTCRIEHRMPVSPVPLAGGFLWSAPFAGAVPVPGLAVNGLLRVDPASFFLLGIGVSNGTPPLSLPLAVPNQTALLGAQMDCQSLDLDATSIFQLAGNDVRLRIVSGPPAGLAMVPIAPGTFAMGSPVTPLNVAPYYNAADAQPVHLVTISRPFWIGRFEVTQAEYQAAMGFNPSWHQGAGYPNAPQQPVEYVSWNEAVAYCNWLTSSEATAGRLPAGYVYRLPTEAEWEYCCRAGTTTEFHTGATLVCGQANFDWFQCANPGLYETAVVGSYSPNAFGLHDMHGNVREWCLDAWDGNANYPAGPATDPFVPNGGLRVARGGGWSSASHDCRSARRGAFHPADFRISLGFRVVCAPVLP
jgi:formylglycine-generating enzyme required for sulfatase activity